MENEIMIRIHFLNGDIKDTTVSHNSFYGWIFKGNAKKYLDKILAPIPKNRYIGFEVFEIDQNRNILKSLEVSGRLNK